MAIEELLTQLILCLISLLANFLSALAGGGAGLVQLPALIFLGLPFPIALATHKLASVALGLGAGFRHIKQNTLKPSLAIFILAVGLPAVFCGAKLALAIPEKTGILILGILTLLVGLYSAKRTDLGTFNEYRRMTIFRLIVGGFGLFIIGLLNGSFSSGTGLFVTLWLVRWFGLSYSEAVAYTLILVGLFWNGTGALVLGLGEEIKISWMPALVIGSLTGGYLGALISLRKGSEFIKRVFEILCTLMGISLVLRACL